MNFSKYDSKSWSLFAVWLQEFNFSCVPIWLKELNFFFLIWLKELCFLTWLKGLNSLLKLTQKGWTFFFIEYDSMNWTSFLSMTQRIWIFFFENDPKKWTNKKKEMKQLNRFLLWFKELNFFFSKKDSNKWVFEYDSQNWTLFLNFFKMTQRVEPFVFLKMSQRIELFFFFSKCSKNWTSLSFELFFTWLNELNFFLNLTRRVEPFFLIWLKELDFFEYDSKN